MPASGARGGRLSSGKSTTAVGSRSDVVMEFSPVIRVTGAIRCLLSIYLFVESFRQANQQLGEVVGIVAGEALFGEERSLHRQVAHFGDLTHL